VRVARQAKAKPVSSIDQPAGSGAGDVVTVAVRLDGEKFPDVVSVPK
jgi:hypothetical protein